MRILFLGDVVGRPGWRALRRTLPRLIDTESVALVVANGENVAGGAGIDLEGAQALLDAGVNVVTSGNHVWRRKEIVERLASDTRFLRPANFPPGTPGVGWTVCETADGTTVGVVNLIGRVFMAALDCPFRAVEALLPEVRARAGVILVDMHGEATSEKVAMGWFLDGRVSAVLGTHTHVQTADDRILPGGTAYMTDVGMCGPMDSVIGVRRELVIRRFLTQMPVKFEVASGPVIVQGALVDIDPVSGKAIALRRVQQVCE
jgi:2',3'-cyclic-nucleotide 2'-phosphodiesterase